MRVNGFRYTGAEGPRHDELYSREAQALIVDAVRKFEPDRQRLLKLRRQKHREVREDSSKLDYRPETQHIREEKFKVKHSGDNLNPKLRRRIAELTTPAFNPLKGFSMLVKALEAGSLTREEIERVDVVLACFEDAIRFTEDNVNPGLLAIKDAVFGNLPGLSDDIQNLATLTVRPPGLHNIRASWMKIDGEEPSGYIVTTTLHALHSGPELIRKGVGLNLYNAKTQLSEEAELRNRFYGFLQEKLGIPYGTIDVTDLIETIWGFFERDAILYEEQDHISALNFGRYDYLADLGKAVMHDPNLMLPALRLLHMDQPFLKATSVGIVQSAHIHDAYGLGGMVADLPSKDPEENKLIEAIVRADKEREASPEQGCDGAWLLNPNERIVRWIKESFRKYMPGDNQLHIKHEGVQITREDVLNIPKGELTIEDLDVCAEFGLLYREPWYRNIGAVPAKKKMHDTATDEIVEMLLAQWQRHGPVLVDGRSVTKALVKEVVKRARKKLEESEQALEKYELSARRLASRVTAPVRYPEFLPEHDRKIVVSN